MKLTTKDKKYDELINDVGILLEEARKKVYYEVNHILVKTYWEIGRRIVEFERAAEESVEYGSKLFEKLAVDLKKKYGKGFSRSNVVYMRLFFQKFPKSQTLSDQLSWIHFLKPIFLQEPVRLSWIVIFNQNIYKSILFT